MIYKKRGKNMEIYINNFTNIDENIKVYCEEEFLKRINEKPKEELDEIWYNQINNPVGIDKEGNLNLI